MIAQGNLFAPAPTTAKGRAWKPQAPPDLSNFSEIELDFETTGLRWWNGDKPIGVAIGTPDGKRQYLPWGHRGGQNLDEYTVIRWLQREVRGKLITNLNTKFEIHMARMIGIDFEAQGNRVQDVGHMAALLDDGRRTFNLESLSQDFLGIGKVEGLDMSRIADYPAGEVAEYAERDVMLPGELKKILLPKIAEQNLHRVLNLECDVMYAICEMERNGAIIDLDLLDKWDTETEQELLRCLWKLHRNTGMKIDPMKVDSMQKLFHKKGIHIELVQHDDGTQGGASFTDAILASHPDEDIQLARRSRQISSLRSKYILKYKANAEPLSVGKRCLGRLRYALHQLRQDEGGTITGRFSASAFRGPGWQWGINIQQVMDSEKQIDSGFGEDWIVRKLFVAENDGDQVVASDARQIEYRIACHYANSPTINEAYRTNPLTDFHVIVGKMIEPYRPGLIRKYIKNTGFAKLYGGGYKKVAWMLGISHKAAKEIIQAYNNGFPEFNRILDEAMNAAKTRGFVRTFTGRRTRYISDDAKRRIYKALSGVVQGGAADVNKIKITELHNERKYTGLILRMTVHDEGVGDVPDLESARKVHEVLNRQSCPELKIPILWKTSIGPSWGELKEIA